MVAGFIRLKPIIQQEEGVPEIFEPWLTAPLDWDDIRKKIGRCVCIFSDDDDYVYHEDASLFADHLGAKTIVMHAMGHFSGSNGVMELPVVLESMQEISQKIPR